MKHLLLSSALIVTPGLGAAINEISVSGILVNYGNPFWDSSVAASPTFTATIRYDASGPELLGEGFGYTSFGDNYKVRVEFGDYQFILTSNKIDVIDNYLGVDTVSIYNFNQADTFQNGLYLNTSGNLDIQFRSANGQNRFDGTELEVIEGIGVFIGYNTFNFNFGGLIGDASGAWAGVSGYVTDYYVVEVAPGNIPEPSAFAAIAGMGVLALAATRRRRRSE